MIRRRRVTESSSSATQTSSDHLHCWLSNTRKRSPQNGLVQVGQCRVIAKSTSDSREVPLLGSQLRVSRRLLPHGRVDRTLCQRSARHGQVHTRRLLVLARGSNTLVQFVLQLEQLPQLLNTGRSCG